MRILFLITARGGSKGIPRKNLRELGGIPLVGFKAISALQSKYCTRLIISSDDAEIQEAAKTYGAEVPFTRPDELASDTATSADVITHAMDFIEQETDETYEAVMLLEPTTPFARGIDYDKAVEIMLREDAQMVVGMRPVEINSTYMGAMGENGSLVEIITKMQSKRVQRRQDAMEYTMNGAMYLFKWDYFKAHKEIYKDRDRSFGYVMDRYHSIDIDEMIDLEWAEFLVEKGYIDISHWK